jgi:hypothetical protein
VWSLQEFGPVAWFAALCALPLPCVRNWETIFQRLPTGRHAACDCLHRQRGSGVSSALAQHQPPAKLIVVTTTTSPLRCRRPSTRTSRTICWSACSICPLVEVWLATDSLHNHLHNHNHQQHDTLRPRPPLAHREPPSPSTPNSSPLDAATTPSICALPPLGAFLSILSETLPHLGQGRPRHHRRERRGAATGSLCTTSSAVLSRPLCQLSLVRWIGLRCWLRCCAHEPVSCMGYA